MTPSARPASAPAAAPVWRGAAVVFGAALALRAALVALAPDVLSMSEDYTGRYALIARALANHGAFLLDGASTAASGPVYPLFLAMVYALVGDGTLAVRLALGLADAVQCALAYMLARRIGGARVAAVAGAAAVLCPYFVYMIYRGFSEPLFLALHTAFLIALVSALGRRSGVRAAGAGALLGLATLCRAAPLLLPVALVVPFAVRYRGRVRAGVLHWGALAAAFLVVLAPWTVRNALVFDRLVPVQSIGGYHVVTGSAPVRTEEVGDADVDAGLYGRALQAIGGDLPGHARLTAERLGGMWYRTNTGAGERLLLGANAVLLLVAAVGAAGLRRRGVLVPLLTVVGYTVAVHSQMVVIFRYVLPLLPILLAFAAVAVVGVSDRLRRSPGRVARGEAVP